MEASDNLLIIYSISFFFLLLVFMLPVNVDGWLMDDFSLFRLHQNILHGPIFAEIKNSSELRAMYVRYY